MPSIADRIAENLERVRTAISEACTRSGRAPEAVQLICVTKNARPEWIEGLLACGETVLGENRPQQLDQRAAEYPDHIQWHLVGQLQRNKVRRTLSAATLVHSVDSLRLLERIENIATDEGRHPSVLLQVNVSDEASKSGFTPATLQADWPRVCELTRTRVLGLMTMARLSGESETARPAFESLCGLAEDLGSIRIAQGGAPLDELSMGMSNDYVVAVEAGATMIRLGRTLFEGLDA